MATTINLQPAGSDKFKGHNGGLLTTAQIQSTLGSGSVAADITDLLVDGISITWDGADVMNAYDPIIGSTCELTFLVDHHDELNALRTLGLGSESETMLKLIWSNGDMWYGCLLPEEMVTDVSDGPTTVKLVFADGLGLLKDIDFKDENGDPYSKTKTSISKSGNLLKWAYLALDKIPYHEQSAPISSEWIRETPVIEAYDGTQAGYFGTFLSDTFTPAKTWDQERVFGKQERDRRELPQRRGFRSTYDVLVDICQTSGYRLCWNMRGWHFFSPLNATSDYSLNSHSSFIWTRGDFNTIATGSAGYDVAGAKTNSAFDPRFNMDSVYHMSGATTRFALPVKTTIATHLEASAADVVQDNGDFFAKASNQPSWNIETADRKSHEFPDLEITEGASMKMRFHSYIECLNYNDGSWIAPDNNQLRAGMKPCLVIRASVGTDGGTQHWLDGPVKSAPENTKLTGAGSDYFGQAWAIFDDATWSTDSSKLCYIPFNAFGHSDPEPESISYLNSAGDEIYSFPMPFNAKLKANETNVIEETSDYDRGIIDWTRTFAAPTGSGNMTGASLDIGIAVFSWDGTELFNSLDPSRASLHGSVSSSVDTIENLFNPVLTNDDRMVRSFEVWSASFTLGTDRGDDREYYNDGGRGSIPLQVIETRVASRNGALWNGAPGTTNSYLADTTFDSSPEFRVRWATSNTNPSNIDLLAEEWLRLFNGSAEGVETDLVPKFATAHNMLTPDMLAYTACLGGGTTYVMPTHLTYNLTSGLTMHGFVADRRDAVSVIDKPLTNEKPQWLQTTLAGGKGRPTTSTTPGADVTNIFGKTTGGNYQVSLENETAIAAYEDGFIHLDSIFGNTGSFAAGEWTGNTVDLSPAGTDGHVLTWTAANGWAPAAGGGGGLSTFGSGFTITDPVGTQTNGQAVAAGTDIEQYLIDMVVSYQEPVVTMTGWAFSGSKEHGTTQSDSTFTLSFTNDGNINTSFTGTAAFTDTYMTNQTSTGITASDGSKTMATCSGTYLVSNAATAGLTGTARSRSGAGKLTVSGFKDTQGNTILDPNGNTTEVTSATVYYRSKVVKNSTNYAGGTISLAGMNALWASTNAATTYYNALSSDPWNYQNTSQTLNNSVGAADYVYVLVPENIWVHNGGTTTGLGTVDIKTYSAGLAYSAPMDWCGTQIIEPRAGYPVKYHAIRVGQNGAMANLPIWFA